MPPPSPPPEAPAPTLPDELLEEVFLRLPPAEPACLARASFASKLWLGLLSCPGFRSRYSELHGAPPMLGFLYCRPRAKKEDPAPRFISTTKFAPISYSGWRGCEYKVWDCRHGRVVIGDESFSPRYLFVWNPIMGRRRELYLPRQDYLTRGVAVLCAVTGCDHRACLDDPFRVVFVGLVLGHGHSVAFAHVSLPQMGERSKPCSHLGEWSQPCPGFHLPGYAYIQPMSPVLIEDALHFILVDYDDNHIEILKYDIASSCFSLLEAPLEGPIIGGAVILIGMEDGSLGLAHVDGSTLNLWSRQTGSDGAALWTQLRVINLKEILPIENSDKGLRLIGSLEGSDIIFVTTDLGIYQINLKSLQWKKLWKMENFETLFPFMSFYSPRGTELALKYNLEMTEFEIGTSYGGRRARHVMPGRSRSLSSAPRGRLAR